MRNIKNNDGPIDLRSDIDVAYANAYFDFLAGKKTQLHRPEIPKGLSKVRAQLLRFKVRLNFPTRHNIHNQTKSLKNFKELD